MLDSCESGMSSARESCKSTALKRCIATEKHWNVGISMSSLGHRQTVKKFGGQAEQESPALTY